MQEIYTYKIEKKYQNNTKHSHQITREENKRRREEKKMKTNSKQQNGNKNIHFDNYLT